MRGLRILTRGGDSRGFTLLEMIIVLAIIVVVVALMAPNLVGMIQTDKVAATEQEAERIYRAIFGNPARGEFGYHGDMGRLPTTLAELVDQGSETAFHTADGATEHVGKVGTGWRGPYLRTLFTTTDLFKDAWGQPFSYTNTGATAGQIISGGPDGDLNTTADNITFPVHAPPTKGTLLVSVLANRIPDPVGATAKLYSPVDGEQTVTPTQKHIPPAAQPASKDTFPGFIFENVTHGLHILVVVHTGENTKVNPSVCVTVTRTVPVAVHAGQQVVKEVRLFTDADVKITDNPCTIPD